MLYNMKVLITGGAGFVGSSLAKLFKKNNPESQIDVLDNLKRRGSEINLPEFKKLGIGFFHGDIRNISDLEDLSETYDFLVEASAEPSVHAGTNGQSPKYLLDTNLNGTLNCLEFARKKTGGIIFLSTSRVYSIPSIKKILLSEDETRLQISPKQELNGISKKGISEEFPTLGGFRSLYGSTKLASELFIEEYSENFGLKAVINRCGVIAGKGQFGKTDQGVFTLWVARHIFKGELSYTGFGGEGKQVRDLLHPKDLYDLILIQMEKKESWNAEIYNAGGGIDFSVSLKEYTSICEEITSEKIKISQNKETAKVDIPIYVSDYSKVNEKFGWKPKISPKEIVSEISDWIQENKEQLKQIF
jgi:CDP-paratose 2-epimerase